MIGKIQLNPRRRRNFRPWILSGVSLVCFVTALAVTPLMSVSAVTFDTEARDSNRVFELRVYHVLSGKMLTLEARFRDTTSKLLDQHNLKVVGFWVGEDNTFVFIVEHRSREDARQNWDAMRADPAFQAVVQTEVSDKTVDNVDSTYMQPTDFSPMR